MNNNDHEGYHEYYRAWYRMFGDDKLANVTIENGNGWGEPVTIVLMDEDTYLLFGMSKVEAFVLVPEGEPFQERLPFDDPIFNPDYVEGETA